MAIKIHPDQGEILVCDFVGSIEPEMNKKRPVIVLTPRYRQTTRLLTVVPLSTTAPKTVQSWHMKIAVDLPHPFDSPISWLKGDNIMTVSFERLFPFRAGKDQFGKRIYPRFFVDKETMPKVWNCVLNGLGRSDLVKLLQKEDEKPYWLD